MMAKRWYEFTEYITPDGRTYRFQNHERFIISEEGYGMPDIEYISQRGPFQHGETIYDYRLRPRVIQLTIRETKNCRTDYWDSRENILNFLRPNRQLTGTFGLGALIKQQQDGSRRAIDVLVQEGPSFDKVRGGWDEFGFQNVVRFIAPDPTFYNPTLSTTTFSLTPDTSSNLIFPFTFDGTDMRFRESFFGATSSITYAGTWMSFPSFTITGPAASPVITNSATGEYIKILRDIEDGETITISLEYGNKSVESDIYGNMIGTIDPESDLTTFHIAPEPEATNGVNPIVFSSMYADTNTSVSISYYVRYIGI